MKFKKGDTVSHKIYGRGNVVRVRKDWYEVAFKKVGTINILKGHSALMPKRHTWSEGENKEAEKFMKRYKQIIETSTGKRHHWRAYGEDT